MQEDWIGDVLRFWFGLPRDCWWKPDSDLDHEIRQRFLKPWIARRQLPVEHFLGSPLAALAAVILFDQFPRHMFRGDAEQYSTDHLALAVAKAAVDRGFDEELAKDERAFLYMPLQHSESLADQRRSVQLFTGLGDDHYLGFARKHLEVIERFGRFPHRNAVLGRQPRPDELAAGEVVPW